MLYITLHYFSSILIYADSLEATVYTEISQGKGSRVRFAFNDVKATIHKPHPQPELKKYSVKKIKLFFENAGISQDLIDRVFSN
jgi:HicA toxin of bacterial toxin-antitoxin,